MKKFNLHNIYSLGKEISAISTLDGDAKISNHIFPLWDARQRLLAMTATDSPVLLSSSTRAAHALIQCISHALPNDLGEALNGDATEVFGWKASLIRSTAAEFETVLGNDMPDIASYLVSQKGIFRTDDLISHAEHHLSLEVRKVLPEQACLDLRAAGKCLAYELPTACVFHLWRAVETMIGEYFERLTGTSFAAANVQKNWGSYIAALTKAKAEGKITVFLDHIRGEYRNPQTHPDEQVPIEEAQRLFSVALSSIEQITLAMNKLPDTKLTAIAAAITSSVPAAGAAASTAKP